MIKQPNYDDESCRQWREAFEYKHWYSCYNTAFAEGEKSISGINPYFQEVLPKFSKDYYDNKTKFSGFAAVYRSKLQEKEFIVDNTQFPK